MKALKKILTTPSNSIIMTPNIFNRSLSLKVNPWEDIENLTKCKFGWISGNLLKIFGDSYDADIIKTHYEFISVDAKDSKVSKVISKLGGRNTINHHPVVISQIFDLLKKQNTGGEGILRTDGWPNIFLIDGNEWRSLGQGKGIKFTGEKTILPLFLSYNNDRDCWNTWSLPQSDGDNLNSDNCQILVPPELNVTT